MYSTPWYYTITTNIGFGFQQITTYKQHDVSVTRAHPRLNSGNPNRNAPVNANVLIGSLCEQCRAVATAVTRRAARAVGRGLYS
jgi:hypothetical protein